MPGKVIFEVTKGELAGKKYEYEQPDRVFVGRQDDCGIVFPEKTVSRYHCLLDINPPSVKLQDFGSLNGTFLNGEKIGQRERSQSWEEAKGEEHQEYVLHDGDVIRLGKSCEFRCGIESLLNITISEDFDGTLPDEDAADENGTLPENRTPEAEKPAAEEQKEEPLKQESLKQESPKKESPKKEPPKQEPLKQEPLKQEPLKQEPLKQEPLKQEPPKQESPKQEPPKQEPPKQEPPKQEPPKKEPEAEESPRQKPAMDKWKVEVIKPKADSLKPEVQKPKEDTSKPEPPKPEAQKPKEDNPKPEAKKPIPEVQKPKPEPKKNKPKPQKQKADVQKPTPKPQKPVQKITAPSAPEKKRCTGCGKTFTPTAPDNNLCPDCLKDKAKVLDGILAALVGEVQIQPKESLTPSPVTGFDKVALLGKGGMGEVWKVKERKTGKYLALKTMLPQIAADQNAKKMFLREAKLSEFLVHKNVVRTYQTGCADGIFYILMDLCEGGSVDELMKKHGGRLPFNLATYIILQVLSGLDYVHNADVETEIRKRGLFGSGPAKIVSAKGIVHRDFKPGNIFLSDKSDHPVALVADFGMAKAFETAGLTDMSAPGAVKGTVPFMPRQQALDCRYAKPEVDVWAAAASYYNMLTGQFPKNLRPGGNIWQAIVTEAAVPIRKRYAAVPEKVAQVIDHALIERPEIGCKSAAVLRRDLISALPPETRSYCKGLL